MIWLAQGTSPMPGIKDIAPPVDVFPYPMWMVVIAVTIALLLIGAIMWAVILSIRSRPAPPPPGPREIALRELDHARAEIERLDPYAFSIYVSDLLRTYITAQYQLRATQQTSPEFLVSVTDSTRFTPAEKQLLAAFLEKCDLIKFARIDATRDDSAVLLQQAVDFVNGGGS